MRIINKVKIIIVIIYIFSARADIPFVAYREGRYLANLELLASIEPMFRNNFSLPIWSGFAFVVPLQGEHNSKGFELAVEF